MRKAIIYEHNGDMFGIYIVAFSQKIKILKNFINVTITLLHRIKEKGQTTEVVTGQRDFTANKLLIWQKFNEQII